MAFVQPLYNATVRRFASKWKPRCARAAIHNQAHELQFRERTIRYRLFMDKRQVVSRAGVSPADQALVERLRGGDEASFVALLDRTRVLFCASP